MGEKLPGAGPEGTVISHYLPIAKSGQCICISCEVLGTRHFISLPARPCLLDLPAFRRPHAHNLTPIVQATTAAWETLIYIASECQTRQTEARAPLGTDQGGKWSFFSLVDVLSELGAPQGSWAPCGKRRVECSEEGLSHFENNTLNNG